MRRERFQTEFQGWEFALWFSSESHVFLLAKERQGRFALGHKNGKSSEKLSKTWGKL